MKKLLAILLCLVLCLSVMTGCSSKDETSAKTVLKNGVIYTVEGEKWNETPAQAVAIAEDGTIIAVGSDSDMEQYTSDNTNVVDLEGKAVLPGFIDTHVHAPGTAMSELYSIYLYEDMTKENSLATIKKYIDEHPDQEEYWGEGYNMGMAADGKGPKKEWLDEICSDKPIILTSNDYHSVWMNSKAFEMNSITKDTPNPLGGMIQKDPNTGELWGVLTDASALLTMEQVFTKEQEIEGFKLFQENMSAWGYTGMSSAGTFIDNEIFKEFEDAGNLNMRPNLSNRFSPDSDFEKDLAKLIEMKKTLDSELIDVTTAKLFGDGVVEGMTAYLLEPYAPEAGLGAEYRSDFLWDPKVLKKNMSAIMKEGFQIHVHSVGDGSTRAVLDAMEFAQKENPDVDARNIITHLQVIDEVDLPRFGELGIIAAAQPFWHLKEPDWFEPVDQTVLGKERASKEYPLKSLKDNGAVLTFSGDFPVSPINNPFWAIEAAVTRNLNAPEYYGYDDIEDMDDPTYLLNADERITLAEAIEAYTKNGAYQNFREDSVGTLAAGKYADMIVLGADPFAVDPLRLDSIKVKATIFNGDTVYGEL